MTHPTPPNLRARRQQAIERQITRLQDRLVLLLERSGRLAQVRLGVFVAGGVLTGATFTWGGWPAGSLGLGIWLVAFAGAVVAHQRLELGIIRHQIWLELKQAQIARMRLDWDAIPPPTSARSAAEHPFARDLDLTGERSLHRLIDSAISSAGSRRLRDWLADPQPDLSQIERRQELVRALIPLSLFRHKLSLYGRLATAGIGGRWDGESLLHWLKRPSGDRTLRIMLWPAALLSLLNVTLFVLNTLGQLPAYWLITLTLYAGLSLWQWREVSGVFNQALTLQNGLKRVEGVFTHLEQAKLHRIPALATLCRPFLETTERPSQKLRQIGGLVAAVGLAQNPFIGLALNLLLPWNLFFAYRLNLLKENLAHTLPTWLEVWFELEALSSLAEFAYLNPGYTFPEVVSRPAIPFEADNLGHPLLPETDKVCNAFRIAKLGDVELITGSNMAGKSSFLRTVGVNLRLAYAGGPVNASACRTGLYRLFTCLNVTDSVTDGISYFYAEVKRLKALLLELEADHPLPLFFAIDEIFRGTNNRERYQGSLAYIRALVGGNGFGLIATHDLELTNLAQELPQINNYHFRETIENGRMVFDYRLHPGPCPTTNALKIMQIEGLPVDGA